MYIWVAAAMFSLTMLWMPAAASVIVTPERFGDLVIDHVADVIEIQLHLAAEEVVGREVAEQQVGVGHRGFGAAAVVADRPGVRSGAFGADLHQAHLVDAGERAAAGADLDQVDDGNFQGQAGAFAEAADAGGFEFVGVLGVRRGRSGTSWRWCRPCRTRSGGRCWSGGPVVAGGDGAGGGAGFNQAHGELAGSAEGGDAAAGEHDVQGALVAGLAQALLEACQVALHQRLDVGVHGGGVAAFVFADFGGDLGGDADRQVGAFRGHDLFRAAFVGVVAVAVEEADGDGFDAVVPEGRGAASRSSVSSRGLSTVPNASMRSATTRRRWRGTIGAGAFEEQVVEVVAHFAADLERVAKNRRW